jgi:hypothetical protein
MENSWKDVTTETTRTAEDKGLAKGGMASNHTMVWL